MKITKNLKSQNKNKKQKYNVSFVIRIWKTIVNLVKNFKLM